MDDLQVEVDDVATMMGFGSFGGQKKRKIDLVSIDNGQPEPATHEGDKASNRETQTAHTIDDQAQVAPTGQTAAKDRPRNGIRNEHGDMAYFLPSFIEDPWKDLLERRKKS